MAYKAKVDFLWYNVDDIVNEDKELAENIKGWLSQNLIEEVGKEPTPKLDFDLNDDGIVDKKDATIASKVLNKVRHRKKRKGR